MNNQIQIERVKKVSLSTVEARHESDPDIRRRFEACLMGEDKTDDNRRPMQTKKEQSISQVTKTLLSHDGGVYRQGSAEVIRRGEMLNYRLINGPMMGLVIKASYQSQGIRLEIYPKSERQSQVLKRLVPRLSQELSGRKFDITLALMPAEGFK